MDKRDFTSAAVDNILKLVVTTSSLAAALVIPNLLIALDKPLSKYLKGLDERTQQRELKRIVTYMKRQNLVSGNYNHGLQVTKKGRKRLLISEFHNIQIPSPKKWDREWRLVLYDIPESHKQGRNALTAKFQELGFRQLQRSVWIHPFPCRETIESVTVHYKIDRYISYIETSYIDNQEKLIAKFSKQFSETNFK